MSEDMFSDMQEGQSPWFKLNQVGDAIKGTKIGQRYVPPTETFAGQQVYEIKVTAIKAVSEENKGIKVGDIVSIGISEKKQGTIARLKNSQNGQIIGFLLESTTPSKTKGFNDTKNIKVFLGEMDPNYNPVEDVFPGSEPVDPIEEAI